MKNLNKIVILLVAVLCLGTMASCQKRVAVDVAPQRVEVVEVVSVPDYLSQEIYFAFDRFNLTNQAQEILDVKVAFMKQNPGYTVTIGGHCDERGTAEYNMALGERRANAAKKYMADRGINPSRIVIISYGEERPANPAHNESAWAQNRRDTFVFQY